MPRTEIGEASRPQEVPPPIAQLDQLPDVSRPLLGEQMPPTRILLSKARPREAAQPPSDDAGAAFAATYMRYEFAPLVSYGIAAAGWLMRARARLRK